MFLFEIRNFDRTMRKQSSESHKSDLYWQFAHGKPVKTDRKQLVLLLVYEFNSRVICSMVLVCYMKMHIFFVCECVNRSETCSSCMLWLLKKKKIELMYFMCGNAHLWRLCVLTNIVVCFFFRLSECSKQMWASNKPWKCIERIGYTHIHTQR